MHNTYLMIYKFQLELLGPSAALLLALPTVQTKLSFSVEVILPLVPLLVGSLELWTLMIRRVRSAVLLSKMGEVFFDFICDAWLY
jgi:hypothetical protein